MITATDFAKLRIEAFEDIDFKTQVQIAGEDGTMLDHYEVLVNPETITRKTAITYEMKEEKGLKNKVPYYNNKPEEFKLDVLLDSTGIIPAKTNLDLTNSGSEVTQIKDIANEVALLQQFCLDPNGKIHRPHFLRLTWGKFLFEGALTALDIDYKLFTPDARPIRAIAHISLISALSDEKAVKLENAQSPDITHERSMKLSDNLPLLVNRIYNTGKYYIDVAQVNKLNSFRKIKLGTKIIFPPVQ